MLSLSCYVFLPLSVLALLASVAVFVMFFSGIIKYKASWTFQPAYIFAAGLFVVAQFFFLLPVFLSDPELGAFESTVIAFYNTLRSFAIDMEIYDVLELLSGHRLLQAYAAFYAIASPVITVGALLSLLKDYFASIRLKLNKMNEKVNVYVFSKLSLESLTLAQDIREKAIAEIYGGTDVGGEPKWRIRRKLRKKILLVFCDVPKKEEDENFSLLEKAYDLDALALKKDMCALRIFANIKLLKGKKTGDKKIWFFAIGENDNENVSNTLTLVNRLTKLIENRKEKVNYNNIPDVKFFVFTVSDESERLFDKAIQENIEGFFARESFDGLIIRVNETRSLVYNRLYDYGSEMFAPRSKDSSQKPLSKNHITVQKRVNAVVVGFGGYGSEMVKALPWYCHMNQESIQIDVFEKSKEAIDKVVYRCPLMFDNEFNGAFTGTHFNYSIKIHEQVDVFSKEFAQQFKALKDVDYVLVALGTDEDNITAAMHIRMLCERMGVEPKIEAVVYDTKHAAALKDLSILKYNAQQDSVEQVHSYNIDFIGDIKSYYSLDNILKPQLHEEAKKAHLHYSSTKTQIEKSLFYTSDYHYRSSLGLAIRNKAREEMGFFSFLEKDKSAKAEVENAEQISEDVKKAKDEIEEARKKKLAQVEHLGWWLWMLAEGYEENPVRNDLAKQHKDMTAFENLDLVDIKKDYAVLGIDYEDEPIEETATQKGDANV